MIARKLNICITSTSQTSSPESFVQAHIDYLPGNVHFLFGDNLPRESASEGNLSIYPNFTKRLTARLGFSRAKVQSPNIIGIQNYLLRHRIDVVFSEFGTTGAEMTPICKRMGLPLVVIFHGGDISFKDLLHTWHDKYVEMIRYASRLLVVSKHMVPTLLNLGAKPEQILFTPYGPDDRFFEIRANPLTSNRFISVGRFVDKKAPHLTLAAFNEFAKFHDDYTLTMVGDGPLLPTIRSLARYWRLCNKVRFTGKLLATDIAKELSAGFCFLQHSVTAESGDMEGTPVGILEACAARLPVISTQHAGIPEVVLDEQTGYLGAEHDVAAMTRRMLQLASSPKTAQVMGKLACEHVRKNFSMKMHIKTIEDALRNATGT